MRLIRGIWVICVPCIMVAHQHISQERKSPAVRAFLDVIACLEGTYDFGYNMKFGGGTFHDYSQHPRDSVCAKVGEKQICSTAAGRYQLSYDEWSSLRQQIRAHTFSPTQQDYAMIYMLRSTQALKHIKHHRFLAALRALRHSKDSVDKMLSGDIKRYTINGLYATYIARYRYYMNDRKKLPHDVLDQYRLQPEMKAFLDTIAFAEGTDTTDGYRICFTGKRCTTLKKHPGSAICSQVRGNKLCSTAAGRYQFLKDTWRQIEWRIAASDFSPRNQDRGAIQIMLDLNIVELLMQDDIETAVKRASKKWASLPGSQYNQPHKDMHTIKRVFYDRLATHRKNTKINNK